jgi:hypothetical protein
MDFGFLIKLLSTESVGETPSPATRKAGIEISYPQPASPDVERGRPTIQRQRDLTIDEHEAGVARRGRGGR